MIDFDSLMQSLSDSTLYFKQHSLAGPSLAFFFAFIESLAIIGSLIPGIVLMSYIGYLMGTNAISIPMGLTAVVLGAFCGDYLSYLAGKHYRPYIIQTQFYQNNRKKWLYGENLLKKNGIIGMTLGRIFGPVRSTIPLIAGLIHMSQKTFFMGACGSVLVWTLCYLSPALIITSFGVDLDLDLSKQLLSVLIQSVLHIAIIFMLIRGYRSNLKKNHITGQSLMLCASLTYMIISLNINSDVLIINHILLAITQSLHHPQLLLVSSFISISADKYTLYGFCLMAGTLLVIKKHYKQAFVFSTATLGVGLAIQCLKIMVNYPRPDLMIPLLGPNAFPSGHTGLYVTTVFAIAYLLSEHYPKQKKPLWFLGSISTLLVISSRLYLGAHWLTDVVGGLLIGQLFYLLAYHWLAPKLHMPPLQKRTTHQIAAFFLLTCLLIPTLRLSIPSLTFHYDPALYQIKHQTPLYTRENFEKKTPSSIQYAQNTLGISLYPLSIQVQSHLHEWVKKLEPEWMTHQNEQAPKLTVLGHPPSLILQHRTMPDHFMILWSYDHLINHNQPIVVGFVFKKYDHAIQMVDAKPFLKNTTFEIEHYNIKPIFSQLQKWNGHIYKIHQEIA